MRTPAPSFEEIGALLDAGCEVRGDAETAAVDVRVVPASEEDWRTEYLAAVLAVNIVDDVSEAIDHVRADRVATIANHLSVTNGSSAKR